MWGSVGFILVTLGTGFLLDQHLQRGASLSRPDLMPVFTYGPLLFLAVAVVSFLVPDRKNDPRADLPRLTERHVPLPLNLRRFLLAFFLYQFALHGVFACLSLYLKALGATPLWITAVWAAGVVGAVLVMTRAGRLGDIYGRRPLLAVAFS